jgi:hypothetical protein
MKDRKISYSGGEFSNVRIGRPFVPIAIKLTDENLWLGRSLDTFLGESNCTCISCHKSHSENQTLLSVAQEK